MLSYADEKTAWKHLREDRQNSVTELRVLQPSPVSVKMPTTEFCQFSYRCFQAVLQKHVTLQCVHSSVCTRVCTEVFFCTPNDPCTPGGQCLESSRSCECCPAYSGVHCKTSVSFGPIDDVELCDSSLTTCYYTRGEVSPVKGYKLAGMS